MYKFVFYVPKSHLEPIKTALFEIGAGGFCRYKKVCWQVQGVGQFEPIDGSEPFIGESNKLTSVLEYRVEMLCKDNLIEVAIKTLLKEHPYETPAYEAYKLDYFGE